jgi:hypothetical protein
MPRSSFSATDAAKSVIAFEYFVKIDLGATGVFRYTTRQQDLTANIDGAALLWSAYDVVVGNLSQAQQSPLEVSWIDIANLNNNWSALIFGATQVRLRPVTVWEVQFNPTDMITILATPKLWEGVIDSADFDGARVRISVVPYRTTWDKNALSIIEPRCPFDYKGPRCQSTSTDPLCDRTRTACAAHVGGNGNNVAHFGGCDWLPAAGLDVAWGALLLSLTGAGGPGGPFDPANMPAPVPRMPVMPGPVRPPTIIVGPR